MTALKAWLANKLPPWLFLIAALGIWQWVVTQGWIASYLLASPWQVLVTTIALWPEIWSATCSTAGSIIWGLSLSIVIGMSMALIFFSIPFLRRAVLPFCIFFQTVPIIAIAPLLVVWFGFGDPTVRASAFIVSLFPILANTLTGLQETDRDLQELFNLYNPSRWQLTIKLRIPGSLPYILTGIRIATGLAVIGAITGEFMAGGGLGALIDSARTQQRVDLVFSGVLMSSLLALTLVMMIDLLGHLLLRRRPYLRNA